MTHPKHIVSAAAIVLNEKREILLIKGPLRGWEMPGGQVEEGESLAQAAVRETKEESGVDIEIIRFCGIFQNVEKSICNTVFLAKAIGGNPIATNESLKSGYYSVEEALEMVTWGYFRQSIEKCLRDDKSAFYVEF